MRDPSPLGCLQKSNLSPVPSLSSRNPGILLPFIFIICSLRGSAWGIFHIHPPRTHVPGLHVWGQWDWQWICHGCFPLLSTVVRRMVASEATFEGDVSRCPSRPGTQRWKRLSSRQRCSIIAAPSARNFLVQRSRLSQLWGSPSESRPRSFPRLSRFCVLSSLCPHPSPRTFV